MKSAGEMSPTEMRAEIFRVARLCAPCLDSMGPATFHGNPAALPELTNWRDSVWIPCLSPALEAALAVGKIGCRELIEVAFLDHRRKPRVDRTRRLRFHLGRKCKQLVVRQFPDFIH